MGEAGGSSSAGPDSRATAGPIALSINVNVLINICVERGMARGAGGEGGGGELILALTTSLASASR